MFAAVIGVVFVICIAYLMRYNLIMIYKMVVYQIYYYIIGSSGMLDDFLYRHSNKTALQSLCGEVAVVTGGSRGIGVEVVKSLLQCDMHVVIGCRNEEAGKECFKILRLAGISGGSCDVLPLDLSSMTSIRCFAKEVSQKYQKINLLVNNAGIMFVPFNLTEDGLESHFAVNYLGHCLLTLLLLPALIAGGEKQRKNARIVNVSSCAYLAGRINFGQFSKSEGYIAQAAYSQSKLAQILFSNKLDKMLKVIGLPVQSVCTHPGLVNTELFNGTLLKVIAPWVPALFFKTPAQGAASLVHAAIASEIESCEGGYIISNCRITPLKGPALNSTAEEKLWDETLRLLNIQQIAGL